MTVTVREGSRLVWWIVTSPGHRVLVDASPDASVGHVVSVALERMGKRPCVHAQAPDGTWFLPHGPIPGDAVVCMRWPDRLVEPCIARHATQADIDLVQQQPVETPR